MALSVGTKLGPYEIQAPLGAGGMGEVYRARDTRLERVVAIKVLPEHLSSDPDLKQRLGREARAISALNHPHICTLYDIGRQGDIEFLVMEYLEGQTLADRLRKGALPTEQLVKIGIEISDALDKAHRHGLVHRDLKPSNIMLTASGTKLLDFGLAKPAQAAVVAGSSAAAATMSGPVTAAGTIVGTFQYMAPELLEGKDADPRSDIFALGAVMYEMATGKPAFQGGTSASVLAAVLASEPSPVPTLKPSFPTALDRLIRTALAKNPDERWQSAHDIAVALTSLASDDPHHASSSSRLWQVIAAALAVAVVAMGLVLILKSPRPHRALRLSIPLPGSAGFHSLAEQMLAVSPDGSQVAFVASDRTGHQLLWVRALDANEARALPGTDDADSPFWSPDSKQIGFFAHSKLEKVDAAGGPPQFICAAGIDPGGATWNRNDVILFAPDFEGILYRVAASGGNPAPVTDAYKAHGETSHLWPNFLPDGQHFLFLVFSRDDEGIHLGSLDSKEHHRLLSENSKAVYVEPGYLLFARNGVVMAQRFDARHEQPLGEPIRIADGVEVVSGGGYSFSASNNGVLVYWTGSRFSLPHQLVWLLRDGKQVGTFAPVGPFADPSLSPNGRIVAVERVESDTEFSIWLIDSRGVPTRFTFGDYDLGAVWAPDGTKVLFASPRQGLPPNLFEKNIGAGSEERRLTRSSADSYATDWSRDGRYILYSEKQLKTNWDVWLLPMVGDRTPKPLLKTQFSERDAKISPDGKWLAYVSDESGKWEVYVQRFLASGGKWQVSTTGGTQPRWSHDGKELFYVAADQKLMVVSLHAGAFEAATPKLLFQLPTTTDFYYAYDVSADGQRFLVNTLSGGETSTPLTVVIDWNTVINSQ